MQMLFDPTKASFSCNIGEVYVLLVLIQLSVFGTTLKVQINAQFETSKLFNVLHSDKKNLFGGEWI